MVCSLSNDLFVFNKARAQAAVAINSKSRYGVITSYTFFHSLVQIAYYRIFLSYGACHPLFNSHRFIFFEKEEDTIKNLAEDKFKDDRRQLRAVATALQLSEKTKLEKLLANFVLDVNKASRCGERTECNSSSPSSDSCISEDSANEQLTDPY